MQLVSFQIKECFGFRDSGLVDLKDPANLIYLLGRNSSGKTSFLTALAHFAPNLTPQAHPNFVNFDRSTQLSSLAGKYEIRKGDLSVDIFIEAFLTRMNSSNQGTSVTINSADYKRLRDRLAEELRTLYGGFTERTMLADSIWVLRVASGEYQFSSEANFKDYTARVNQQIPRLLSDVPAQVSVQVNGNNQIYIGGSWQPLHLPTPKEIESLFAYQLPKIAWFGKEYSLLDGLPDNIKIEHLTQSPGELTTALIEYLGKPQVERLLTMQNPLRRRELETELQGKIDKLVKEVNRDRAAGTELLAINLDRVDGLQVTVFTGNKSSFYRHLSDNTKILFAYHLYATVHNLQGEIFLFDEPNNGFHATAQERLLGFLRNLGATGNLVIISTHSEHLIDPDHLTGIRLMATDSQGYLSVRNKWYESTKGHGDFLALRPILDAIGLRYGANNLTIRNKVIVTEGVTELLYLCAFRQLLGYQCELHIAPATGDATIMPLVALLISQGLHFKVVVDTIVHGKSSKDKLQEEYGIPDISIFEVEIPTGFPQAKGSGIEDVFSKADFTKLLTSTGNTPRADFETLSNSQYMKKPDVVPKRVVAHEFNKHVTKYYKDDFDEETLTNMRHILDFCMNEDWFFLS